MCTASKSAFDRGERLLAVDWQDCRWRSRIAVQSRQGEAPDGPLSRAVKRLSPPPRRPVSPQPDLVSFKTMKAMPIFSRLRL